MNLPKSHDEMLVLLDSSTLSEFEKIELVHAYARAARAAELKAGLGRLIKSVSAKLKAWLHLGQSVKTTGKVAHG